MKKYTVILLLLSIGILNATCKKIMPRPTHRGANTFGCYVDGKKYVSRRKNDFFSQSGPGGSFINNKTMNFGSGGDGVVGILYTFNFSLQRFTGTGVYALERPGNNNNYFWDGADSLYTGEVNITHYYSVHKIIAGTFWVNINRNNQIIKITEGRFDINYEDK